MAMIEELLTRQRQLETEVKTLKETICRLCNRILVLETFIKDHHHGGCGCDLGFLTSSSEEEMRRIEVVGQVPLTVINVVDLYETDFVTTTTAAIIPNPGCISSTTLASCHPPIIAIPAAVVSNNIINSNSVESECLIQKLNNGPLPPVPDEYGMEGEIDSRREREEESIRESLSSSSSPRENQSSAAAIIIVSNSSGSTVCDNQESCHNNVSPGKERILELAANSNTQPPLVTVTPLLDSAPVPPPPPEEKERSPKLDNNTIIIPHPESSNNVVNISEPSAVKCLPVRPNNKQQLVDIGLQTDLEEDPEIYYFAGGRHVGSQTDCDGEYEPLIPFKANTKLEIVVLSDASPAVGAGGDCLTSSVSVPEFSTVVKGTGTTPEIKKMEPKQSQVEEVHKQVAAQIIKVKEETVVVTPKVEKDGWKTVTARSNRTKWSQSSSSLGSHSSSSLNTKSLKGSLDRISLDGHRGTVAANNNSIKSNNKRFPPPTRMNASHSIDGSNRPKSRETQRKLSHNEPVTPKTTSNLASFLKSRYYQPSSTISLPVLNDRSSAELEHCPGAKKSAEANKPLSSQRPASQQRSTQTVKKFLPAGANGLNGIIKGKSDEISKKIPERKVAPVQTLPNSPLIRRTLPGKGTPKPPTLVPAPAKSSILRINANNKERNNLDNLGMVKKKLVSGPAFGSTVPAKPAQLKKPLPKAPARPTAAPAGNNREKSTKDSTVLSLGAPGKLQKVMQDSNSDLELNNENELQEEDWKEERKWKDDREKWKEQHDTESSNDDEEIQKKDAAIESAIKDSDLLAEELLQVEKDFEEIENRSTADNESVDEGSHTSECETSTITFTESEENESNVGDFDSSDMDQFFFIAINNDGSGPGGILSDHYESLEERIVAKKEKLRLSPAKKWDSAETLKRHQAKLAKAERNRESLLEAKYNRYVELSERFASLNETTKRLVEERYDLISKAEDRRKRAAEKRELHLKSIVRKAHDEDSKAKEIAFINYLEAQNKRHDYLANVQEVEERLNSILEERKTKLEDRAIKVQAVIDRQNNIRQNWEEKLATMQEKRRKIYERITREREERAKERSEIAQEKARDREERLSALNALKKAEKEVLQKKIKQRQEETARRHEENIEQIRQKAIEFTLPRTCEDHIPSTLRMCSLCKVTMQSEVQELVHLRRRSHLDAVRKVEQETGELKLENFGLKYITDVQVDKVGDGIRHDKSCSNKKHCKKIMIKLVTNGEEFEKVEKEQRIEKPWGDPTLKAKVCKSLKELERAINLYSMGKGSLSVANSMDKLLADIRKTINKNKSVQDAVISLNMFPVVSKILRCEAMNLPPKILIGACNLIVGATYQHLTNGIYALRSTVVCHLIDLVVTRLKTLIPEQNRWITSSPGGNNDSLQSDSVADFAIETLFTLLSIVPDPYDGISKQSNSKLSDAEILDITYRTQDIIAYLVSANVIDRISVYCGGVRGPVDNQPEVANLLKISLDFLTALVWCLTFCLEKRTTLNGGKRESDPTQLLAVLESSELAGSISMSYALLLYQGAPIRPRLIPVNHDVEEEPAPSPPPPLSPPPPPGVRTASVIKSTLCLVNAVAQLDITALQTVLGSEAMSLQFRHIASQLLWQVVPHREDRALWGLLQELFIALGNFTVKNIRNQVTIQSGQTPTVLQQLCTVAKDFLTDLRLSRSILPTLIAATHGCQENRDLLVQESFPVDLLDGFLESKFGYANVILKRLTSSSLPPLTSNNNKNNNNSSNNNNNNSPPQGDL